MVKDVRTILQLASVSGDHEEYFLQEESKVIIDIIGKFGFK